MDTDTKKNKTLGDYMREVEPYGEDEVWADECRTLEDAARCLVSMEKELKEGKYD